LELGLRFSARPWQALFTPSGPWVLPCFVSLDLLPAFLTGLSMISAERGTGTSEDQALASGEYQGSETTGSGTEGQKT
jgi:hypothetical protein